MLNRQRADNKKSWLDLGRVFHSISNDLLEDWVRLSKKSVHFEEGACEKVWAEFPPPKKSELDTLRKWARQDSPEVFEPHVSDEILHLWNKRDRGLAEMAYIELKDVVRLSSGRGYREYYYFDSSDCLWRKVSDSTIKVTISKALEERLRDVVLHYTERARNCKEDEKKLMDVYIQDVQKAITYVLDNRGLNNIVALASEMFLSHNFEQQLDRIPHLIGVRNGVIDLTSGKLRDRRPEDMIYKVLDIDYDENADTSLVASAVKTTMAGSEEMAHYLQKLLGYAITGEVSEEIFVFFTGKGRNGKGLLIQSLQRLIGDYFKDMNCAVIMERVTCNIEAEKAKLQGGRVACFNEPKQGDRLKTNELQLLSGGDGIPAKALYKDPITITPQHLCIVTTNHLPEINEVIPAIIQRLIVIEFPVTFTDLAEGEKPTPYRQPINRNLKKEFATELSGFLRWVVLGAVEWYKTKDLKRNAPKQVKAFTRKYLVSQDKLQEFIDLHCEIGDNYFLPYCDLVTQLSDFTHDDRIDSKVVATAMVSKGFTKGSRRLPTPKGSTPFRGYVGLRLKSVSGETAQNQLFSTF